MLGYLDAPTSKPNRVKPKDGKKDEKYHADYSKYCISNSYSDAYWRFVRKYQINKRFYSGRQWEVEEDLETFLKDTDGNERNRIQVVFNIIRPLVENYRGNSNILRIGASCKSTSPRSITRKDEQLEEILFKREVADQSQAFEEAMAEDPNLGRDEAETQQIFENRYVDQFSLNIDRLMKYVDDLNDFESLKIKVGEDMALAGLGVVEGFEYGNHMRFENVPPDEFFWDTTAKQYDFNDAEYMGRAYMAMPSEIFEQYQVGEDDQENIESYVENNGSSYTNSDPYWGDYYRRTGYNDNRIPVYRVFWKDIDKYEYGYVYNDTGEYKMLVRLDEEDEEGNKKYKDADVVEPPKTISKALKRKFKGKNKAMLTVDILRYCVLIPADVISSRVDKKNSDNEVRDIVLEYGVYDYQEKEHIDFRSVKFPFKCYCWGYVDGEVLSPVDDAISPQRFINRVLSVFENQVNNSGGTSFIYDSSAVDPADGEEMLMKNISMSRPIKMNSRGIGMPNIIAPYDNSPKAGTYGLLDIIPTLKGIVDQTTGVNEALRGESIGQDQLVGVTQSLIQRGSLMQEPFYHGLTRIFQQMYQMTATVGRNIYIDNEAQLHIAVGDEAAARIKLSKDMKLEDFRVFIKREQDDETQKQTANQMLMLFLEMQLIDDKEFANLYDRSTPAEVTNALRMQARARIELEKQQAEAEAQSQEQMLMQEQAMMQQQAAQQEAMDDKKHAQKLDEIILKEEAKMGASNPTMGM